MDPCPLCAAAAAAFFNDEPRGWRYGRCPRCALIFRTGGLLAPEDEKHRYAQHQNNPDQEGYRRFLEPMAAAIMARCAQGAEGLDYGCGPGPVLALMLGERGMKVALHDPHFAPGPAALKRRYDFITCTEAAEHFRAPGDDFRQLARLLKPGGWLGVMTSVLEPRQDFASWHYRLDPTHIRFYSDETMAWLARTHGWRLERPARHLALFQAAAV